MEIVHESHDHPLRFTDAESEDNQDEGVVCWGCEDVICGPRFSCITCKFHLHESCTDLPPRLLDHPLHPQHALRLLSRPLYARKRYICDACEGKGNGFVYHCYRCNFNLHIMCALPFDQEGSILSESTGEKAYFRYGLHQHLLVLEEEQSASLETNSVNCFVCFKSISAPFFFCSRLPCEFRIHKFCANLPKQFKLPKQIKDSFLHPEPSLFLVLKSCRRCEICGQKGRSSYYACIRSNFFIHPKCVFSNPMDTIKRVGEKQIQNHSHDHLLTLLEDEKERARTEKWLPFCCLCMEELGPSPSYSCDSCYFILHKSCAEIPSQVKSHLHPEHFLILFATTGSRRRTYCDCCAREVRKLNYRCLQCGFSLHLDCFLSLRNSEHDHHHSFVGIKTFRKLVCDACGEEDYFSPWQCTVCHLMVHKQCAEYSRFLRVDQHNHDLKLTYYLSVVHKCDKLKCQLCYREVNADYAVYYCYLCNYATHLRCTQEIGVVVSEEEFVKLSLEGSHNSIPNSSAITLLGDAIKSGEIKHFSHQHELTLNEQDLEDHKYCEGCVTLISSPFYSCKDCGFYLHKQCAEFPNTKKLPFHRHLLHLNPVEEFHYCRECEKTYNGFMYSCQYKDCFFRIDLHCVKLMEGLEHPCHEHRLFFVNPHIRINERCQGCGYYSRNILVCSECEYVLGYCCAKFPHRVKHRYDDHLLSLAFKKENECSEYYCDICEGDICEDLKDEDKRNSDYWFYCCIQCDFFTHINCALGDYPFIKFGTSLRSRFHDHLLTYVEQPTRQPPLCSGCGKHCYSRVLECHRCSFYLHSRESCINKMIEATSSHTYELASLLYRFLR